MNTGKKLYGFSGWFTTIYFDTKEELDYYLKNNNPGGGCICILEYLGNFEGKKGVIKKTFLDGRKDLIATPIDYNYFYRFDKNDCKWYSEPGDLEREYDAFRERGVVDYDVYGLLNKEVEKFGEWFDKTINNNLANK